MVRVRFAPSPTGDIHIGNLRAALFNYIFAKKEKGVCVLRIEDTDLDRSTEQSIKGIIEDLDWLGISFDEGAVIGGSYGPYRQTERLSIYKEYADRLLKEGKAKKDFSHRDKDDKADTSYAIKLKTNKEVVEFDDIVFGRIKKEVEDFIIMKSNSIPTYHFAVVIDDYLMKISHVIRGQDHLGNTAKHVFIARALGITPPQYAHFSLTKGLSKRDKSNSIKSLRERGYLPETIVNMAMLLGWAPKDGKEKFNIFDIVSTFNLSDLTKANAIFDEKKFNWLSSLYIKDISIERLQELALPYLLEAKYITNENKDTSYIKDVILLVKENLSSISQITEHTSFFFKKPTYNEDSIMLLDQDKAEKVLRLFAVLLEGKQIEQEGETKEKLSEDIVKAVLKSIQKTTKIKGKALFMPIRLALTGEEHGPELNNIIPILGIKECIERIGAFAKIQKFYK